ncbi:MAG: L-histidine N(alpha)-methyltransferase, partial [Nanoarchaeota archaeon]
MKITADVLGETLLKELARQLPADGLWRLDEPKLWWLTEKQRKAYRAIQNQSSYSSLVENEEKSLAASIDEILEGMHPSYSVADLGCGNGKKAGLVLAAAKQHGQSPVYMPVDINPVYVATASKAASGYAPVMPITADFMTLDLTKSGSSDANLVLFLGNT